MAQIVVLLVLRIVGFLGALASTVGFVGLFAFEALEPYKWQLLIGGLAVVAVTEVIVQVWARTTLKAHAAQAGQSTEGLVRRDAER